MTCRITGPVMVSVTVIGYHYVTTITQAPQGHVTSADHVNKTFPGTVMPNKTCPGRPHLITSLHQHYLS